MGSHLTPHSLAAVVRLAAVLSAVLSAMLAAWGCLGASPAADTTFEQMVGSAPGAGAQSSTTRRGALWYHIEANQKRLDIHVRLVDPPERTSFFLPGSWAGRSNLADNINIKGAVSEDGPVPFTISRSEGRIDVESQGARWVQLSYAVNLRRDPERLERFHPQFADEVLFAYGPAFIVLPSEQISRQVRDIPIEVRVPSTWRLLTTWEHLTSTASHAVEGSTVHGFVAPTPGALRDAFVAAGASIDVRKPAIANPDSPLAVGFSPGLEVDRDAYSSHIAEIVDAYRQRFGDLGPVTAYVRAVDGRQVDRGRGVGRRGGFVVEIPAGPVSASRAVDDTAMLLLAHEALHLWNGHHLTPQPSAEKRTRWFKEGVTHYLALKVLAELRLFSRADVLRELSRSASYYQRNPASRRQDSSKADRARLPYDKGVLLAVALDAALLAESKGRVGVEDWMRLLVEKFGNHGDAYAEDELREALVQVAGSTGAQALEIWDAHITESKPLEPSQIFAMAGLHWLEGVDRGKSRLLPVKRAESPFQQMFPIRPTPQQPAPPKD